LAKPDARPPKITVWYVTGAIRTSGLTAWQQWAKRFRFDSPDSGRTTMLNADNRRAPVTPVFAG
jgi:hypothetical protein